MSGIKRKKAVAINSRTMATRLNRKADVEIQVKDPRWKTRLRPCAQTVREACNATLGLLSRSRGELEIGIILADDPFIRELNHTYRGKDKPTNVLSFEGEGAYLGDIVLAFETVAREAQEQGKTFRDHATHLIVHGTLHLLGHDHMRRKEAEDMEAKEIKILKKLGVANPYL